MKLDVTVDVMTNAPFGHQSLVSNMLYDNDMQCMLLLVESAYSHVLAANVMHKLNDGVQQCPSPAQSWILKNFTYQRS